MAVSTADQLGQAGLVPTSLIAFAFFGVLYAVYVRLLLPRPFPGIPYNKGSEKRLLGDAPDMLKEVGVTRELNVWLLKQVNKLQAPLCQVFVTPLSKPWLLLADSAEAQDIMTRRPEWDRSNFITDGLAPLDGFHARMKTGKTWKQTRAWLQDLMGPSFLNNIVGPVMYDNAIHLVEFWENKARVANGRPFDVNEDLNHSALDGMLAFVFDRHFEHTAIGPQFDLASKLDPSSIETGPNGEAKFPEAPLNEFITALYQTVDAIDQVTKSVSPTFTMWWLRQTPRYKKVMTVKRKVVKEQVRGALRRLETTGVTKTAIEHMLMREKKAAEKQGRKPDYESPILMEEIAGQFIAGLHTTSTTLAWTFIYLTRLPEIQANLRDALYKGYPDAHAEKRFPTLAELNKARVPYLEAVLEEALRLHATSVARQATRDTELFGHPVPKGTNVILIANGPGFHAPSMQVDPARRGATVKTNNGWDESRDMSAFDPERWLVRKEGTDEVEFDANAAPQIAFGMGPRSCWGRRLAYLELRMVATLVVWNFDLLSVPPALADPKASYGIVHRADQCCLRLRSRRAGGEK
ncbi:cytochrome P450 [Trematosphaeria pertusa]|uniref:Cytochrome P450 n=1 Tax=Trematosphaeria pertusa TaxID=390896 RepID=A0A6A6IKN1_9PLEO|nr:cytochrome P450 [Trematosphaeria pertusa]KAF2251175.1 cytochrome P450 [Trematosphaeria pertusa]